MKEPEFRKRQQDLFGFDLPRSRALRNEAFKRNETGAEDWKAAAFNAFVQFAQLRVNHNQQDLFTESGNPLRFITEDFRKWWMNRRDYRAPRHHNAWGALTAALAKSHLIRATGYVRAASSLKSHARKMLEWEIVSARSS